MKEKVIDEKQPNKVKRNEQKTKIKNRQRKQQKKISFVVNLSFSCLW